MANKISDETIEYVGILAKLELSGQEKEDAKADMEKMLDYIDTLNELDTDGIEPMSHVFPVKNVFRSWRRKVMPLIWFCWIWSCRALTASRSVDS